MVLTSGAKWLHYLKLGTPITWMKPWCRSLQVGWGSKVGDHSRATSSATLSVIQLGTRVVCYSVLQPNYKKPADGSRHWKCVNSHHIFWCTNGGDLVCHILLNYNLHINISLHMTPTQYWHDCSCNVKVKSYWGYVYCYYQILWVSVTYHSVDPTTLY